MAEWAISFAVLVGCACAIWAVGTVWCWVLDWLDRTPRRRRWAARAAAGGALVVCVFWLTVLARYVLFGPHWGN